MTIKTFDPNRVGGGTFQLEQDSTGAYTIKEVGFVKLPDLKLPEIDQAAYTAPPDTDDDDDTTPDPCPPGFKLVNGVCQRIETSSSGGGGGGQQDFTGESMYKNIKTEATGGNTLMESAQKFSGQDTGIKVENIGNDPEQNSALISYNQALKVYNDAVAKTDTSNPNEMKNVDEAKALVDKNREFYEKSVAPGGLFFEGTMKDAPIGDFSKGPRTVPTGTLTGTATSTAEKIPDRIMQRTSEFGALKIPEATKPSVMENVKKLLDPKNSVVVKIASGIGTGLKGIENALLGPEQVALNTSNKNALNSLGYKTNFELGNTTDPGRIKSAINPDGSVTTSAIDNVFIGMNKTSATGNVMSGARKRVSTVQKTIDKAIAAGDLKKAERFKERKERYNAQIEAAQKKKNEADLATGGVAPGASGGGGDPGCFIKGTLITMFDGSKKPVEKVDLGDNVAIGGKVFAVGRFLNTELYDYKGIKVSGSHMVNEDGTWLRVKDTKHGKSLGDGLNTVYVFGSENRRILIDDILFTDYFEVSEQDQLIKDSEDFFNNWKSYGNTINEHNVNTLNAN